MSNASMSLNNAGQTGPLGALDAAPVHGTGGVATDAATGGDETLTVTAGATYLIMATPVSGGNLIFGLATILTAANVAWFVPAGQVCVIRIPLGYTTLHWESLANGGGFYYVKLTQ
jgi:hypothetical protein